LAKVRVGRDHLCQVWQVTLCDPIWQVTLRSSEMGSHEELTFSNAHSTFNEYN